MADIHRNAKNKVHNFSKHALIISGHFLYTSSRFLSFRSQTFNLYNSLLKVYFKYNNETRKLESNLLIHTFYLSCPREHGSVATIILDVWLNTVPDSKYRIEAAAYKVPKSEEALNCLRQVDTIDSNRLEFHKNIPRVTLDHIKQISEKKIGGSRAPFFNTEF